jgi:hypothetical protein
MMVEAKSAAAIHQRKCEMARRTVVKFSWTPCISVIVDFQFPIWPRSCENCAAEKNLRHPTAGPVLKRVYYESAVWLLYLSAR